MDPWNHSLASSWQSVLRCLLGNEWPLSLFRINFPEKFQVSQQDQTMNLQFYLFFIESPIQCPGQTSPKLQLQGCQWSTLFEKDSVMEHLFLCIKNCKVKAVSRLPLPQLAYRRKLNPTSAPHSYVFSCKSWAQVPNRSVSGFVGSSGILFVLLC